MKNLAKLHPNATAVAGTGGGAALIVTVLAAFNITIDTVTAAWIVATVPTVFLALKREGVKGYVLQFWKGDDSV